MTPRPAFPWRSLDWRALAVFTAAGWAGVGLIIGGIYWLLH